MTANNDWNPVAYDASFGFVAEHGRQVLELLGDVADREILDLGCGTGTLTAELAARGARVLGVDLSHEMVAAARRTYPELCIVQGDGQRMTLSSLGRAEPFDAVFSNAALHWMPDGLAVAAAVAGVLRHGGTFVAELGGQGNVSAVDRALRAALAEHGLGHLEVPTQNFPSVATQATWLEAAPLSVRLMRWYERPTPLGRGVSVADWTRHFRAKVWSQVPGSVATAVAARIDELAAEAGLASSQGRHIDYCRLQFVAVKG